MPPAKPSAKAFVPPLEAIAMHRLAFGPRPGDAESLRTQTLPVWLAKQLKPNDADDTAVAQKLAEARLHIEYEAGEDNGKKYPAVKEDRPLNLIGADRETLWRVIAGDGPKVWQEKYRPLQELRAAAFVRAVHTKFQVREVLVHFWHDHFNVNAHVDDERCRVMLPHYDREVVRRHALGNFREFLEAVATSVPMLVYLNNNTSKASPANENFARELFELHTLGRGAYMNDKFHRWRDVPGAAQGKPEGYIDQDVYEAARAFTGWTFGSGEDDWRGGKFPSTGAFYYHAAWHDPYQKRVLGVEMDSNQPPLADGRRVLDLVAFHPATARHVVGKLARRLVGDEVSKVLLDRAVAVWDANKKAKDQIAKVVECLVLSPEFASTWGTRAKRPFELAAAFMRATEADPTPNDGLIWTMGVLGHDLFAWQTPDGTPDSLQYWTGTGGMVGRWNLPIALLWNDGKMAKFPPKWPAPNAGENAKAYVGRLFRRMNGYAPPDQTWNILALALTRSQPDTMLKPEENWNDRAKMLCGLIAMTPEAQVR